MSKENIFTMMDNYLIVHSKGEIKQSSVLVPNTGSYEQRKQWIDNDNEVYSVAKNIEDKVKVGDRVILTPHTKLRKIEEITKIIEEKTGKTFKIDIKDKDGKKIADEDTDKFFIVHIDDILCVIN